MSGLFIVIESWYLSTFKNNYRGKGFAIYMIVLYSSYSIGQFFLLSGTTENNLHLNLSITFLS